MATPGGTLRPHGRKGSSLGAASIRQACQSRNFRKQLEELQGDMGHPDIKARLLGNALITNNTAIVLDRVLQRFQNG